MKKTGSVDRRKSGEPKRRGRSRMLGMLMGFIKWLIIASVVLAACAYTYWRYVTTSGKLGLQKAITIDIPEAAFDPDYVTPEDDPYFMMYGVDPLMPVVTLPPIVSPSPTLETRATPAPSHTAAYTPAPVDELLIEPHGGVMIISPAPALTTTAPTPTATAPALTTVTPTLTTTAPALTTTAPALTTTAPALTTTAPALTTKAPALTTTAPALTTTAPALTTATPTPMPTPTPTPTPTPAPTPTPMRLYERTYAPTRTPEFVLPAMPTPTPSPTPTPTPTPAPTPIPIPVVDEAFTWAKRVSYRGEVYAYNDELINLLLLGIDDPNPIIIRDTGFGLGDQSDFVLLVTLNPDTGALSLLSVNRDTMTNVKILSYDHKYVVGQRVMQLTLAHAYGDGGHLSARLMTDAVSGILGGLPIHAYVSLNYGAVPILNDAVGGVLVGVNESMTLGGKTYYKGSTAKLVGNMATDYVRARMNVGDGTNLSRMTRQKLYLSAYLNAAKNKLKSNPSFVMSLYTAVEAYLVTSLGQDEIIYLGNLALSNEWQEEIDILPGELVQGDVYYEYYIDAKICAAAIIDRFYICESDSTYKSMRAGYRGNDIIPVKKRLRELGYNTYSLNGDYLDDLVKAIELFQQNNGLLPTGIASDLTQRVLFSDAAVRANG